MPLNCTDRSGTVDGVSAVAAGVLGAPKKPSKRQVARAAASPPAAPSLSDQIAALQQAIQQAGLSISSAPRTDAAPAAAATPATNAASSNVGQLSVEPTGDNTSSGNGTTQQVTDPVGVTAGPKMDDAAAAAAAALQGSGFDVRSCDMSVLIAH